MADVRELVSQDRSSRYQQVDEIIRSLVASTPHVQGAALVSLDGFPLATAMPPGTDEDRTAAMAAAALSLAERMLRDMHRGTFEQVYMKGSEGFVLVIQAGDDAILQVLTTNQAKLGVVLLEAARCAGEVARLL